MHDLNRDKPQRKRRIWLRVLIILGFLAPGVYVASILLESTPPTLTLSGLEADKTYQGTTVLHISAKDARPGVGSLVIQIDDASPIPLSLVESDRTFWTLDTTLISDGEHTISVTATDRSVRKNETRQDLNFYVDNTAPQLHLFPESQQVQQGRTLAILVQTDEPISALTGEIFDRDLVFYPTIVENVHRSLMGIGVRQPTKSYPLTLRATDRIGNSSEQIFTIEVGKTTFARGGYIKLSPQKQQNMMDKSKNQEDNAKRGSAYTKADREPKQLWQGKFVRPAEGRISSPFGKYREYNTGVRRHHLGTDIANVEGTQVHAGNSGFVTLAERLHIYGNAVIINHGQKVSTSYNHLSEIHVQVGDWVEKGQQIGLMGATGQATGSHLHWGMVVSGVAVAPEEWAERDFSPAE